MQVAPIWNTPPCDSFFRLLVFTETNLFNLRTRQLEPEIMDDPDLDPVQHQRALEGLTRVHAITNSAAQLWKIIKAQITASGKPQLHYWMLVAVTVTC